MKTRITQIHNLKDLIVKSADGIYDVNKIIIIRGNYLLFRILTAR